MTRLSLNVLAHSVLVIQLAAPLGTVVAGSGYEGVIVSAARVGATATDAWTPTEAAVRAAERGLAHYLTSTEAASLLAKSRIPTELPRYKRQYWGVVRGGRRALLISFIYEPAPARPEWRTTAFLLEGGGYPVSTGISVAGGGDRYFSVRYDVESKQFSGLKINSPI